MRYTLGIWGFILLVAAVALTFNGMNMNTTIPAAPGTSLPSGLDGIANIQLMHVQLLYVILGAVCGLASCCFFVGAAIVAVLQDVSLRRPGKEGA